jgi:hypothetical protein
VKLCIDSHPSPGFMKQNLASVRVVSFLALAWLCAQATRLGWLRMLAERLPAVVTVGKQGLVCFVGGTVVSIVVDTAMRLLHCDTNWFARLAADIVAIAALLTLARIAAVLRTVSVVNAGLAPAARFAWLSFNSRSPRDRHEP